MVGQTNESALLRFSGHTWLCLSARVPFRNLPGTRVKITLNEWSSRKRDAEVGRKEGKRER
jgi:hypothetical protein